MDSDLKILDNIVSKYSIIKKEIENIKINWVKTEIKLDKEVSWDNLADEEEKFINLRKEDIKYIKTIILECGDNIKLETN